MTGINFFPQQRPRPLPKPTAYPSDYGLALAADNLIRDYGRAGAINRLIEMAERIAAEESPYGWVFRRRRVEHPRHAQVTVTEDK